MKDKLDFGQRHVLKLIDRDKRDDGWTTISHALYKIVSSSIPPELAEFEPLKIGGRCRLTEQGQKVVDSMVWL